VPLLLHAEVDRELVATHPVARADLREVDLAFARQLGEQHRRLKTSRSIPPMRSMPGACCSPS